MQRQEVLVGRRGRTLVVRIVGLGSMNNSQGIYDHVRRESEAGATEIAIDLSACSSMDSTFMGMLLLLHEECSADQRDLLVVNVAPDNIARLESLGVSQFVRVVADFATADIGFAALGGGSSSTERRMGHVLAAHEELVRKDKRNEGAFRSFLTAMRESLKSKKK